MRTIVDRINIIQLFPMINKNDLTQYSLAKCEISGNNEWIIYIKSQNIVFDYNSPEQVQWLFKNIAIEDSIGLNE